MKTPHLIEMKMEAEALGYRVQSENTGDGLPAFHLFKPGKVFHCTFATEERAWRLASKLILLREIEKLQSKITALDAEDETP